MEIDELQVVIEKLWVRVDTINDRTKLHTRYIKELEKEVKELKRC